MKKIYYLCPLLLLLLTSCYNTKIAVGELPQNTPLLEVGSVWTNHFIYGLIPGNNASLNAKDYVGDNNSYIVKTSHPFIHQLVGALTLGIYTPSETKFYVPASGINTNTIAFIPKIAFVKNGYIAYEYDSQNQYLNDVISDADYNTNILENGYYNSLRKTALKHLNIYKYLNPQLESFGFIDAIVGKYGNVVHAQLAIKEDIASHCTTSSIASLLQEIYNTLFLPIGEDYPDTQKLRIMIQLFSQPVRTS